MHYIVDDSQIYEEKYQENSPWGDKDMWLHYHLDRLDAFEEIRQV
jgi:hypothetical protein